MDPQALELATKTLAAAIDSLMVMGSPFLPIVQVQRAGAIELRRVVADRVEEAAAAAKQMAAEEVGADATAYAIDGYITYNGSRSDGIIVEAWNFQTNRGARVGLRYELKGIRKKPSLIGSPLHLGREGWFDPEEGEPAEAPTFPEVAGTPVPVPVPIPVADPAPVAPAVALPVMDLPVVDDGYGPPPAPESIAPADIAPPPPLAQAAEPPALPRVFSAPPTEFGPPPTTEPEPMPMPAPARELPSWPAPTLTPPEPVGPTTVTPEPPAQPDFGPPPTTAPVLGFPPPGSPVPQANFVPAADPEPVAPEPEPVAPPAPEPVAPPEPVAAPVRAPIADSAPPTAAHPVEVPAKPAALPSYPTVPLQRNETPLGNRAMFAGIMELATKSRSFPAFAIVQKDGAWEQVTMTDASLERAAASVREYARSRTDAEFIAFAVDGFVTVDGAPVTAVIVEVWEYATRVSFSVAQRYLLTGTPPSPRLSGRPLMRTQEGWVDVPSQMTLGGQVQFGYRDPDPV